MVERPQVKKPELKARINRIFYRNYISLGPYSQFMRFKSLLLSLAVIVIASSCTIPAKIVNTYKEPNVIIQPDDLQYILLAVMARNENQRQMAEDYAAKKHPKLIQSYNYLPLGAGATERTKAKRIIKEEGFDGVLLLRLVDEDNKVIYASEKLDTKYWDNHNGFWSDYYEPGYYTNEARYYIEVRLYRLTDEKMIWSGLSNVIDPTRVDFAVESVLEATIKEMRAEGFLN